MANTLLYFNEKDAYESIRDSEFENDEEFKNEIERDLKYIIQSKEPSLENYKKQILIIDNIPCVNISKIDKLKTQFNILFKKLKVEARKLSVPMDGEKSKGIIMVFFETIEDCIKCRDSVNLMRFSPTHIIRCVNLDEYDKLINKELNDKNDNENKIFNDLPGINCHLNEISTLAISNSFGTVYIYSISNFKEKYVFERFSPRKVEWSPLGTYLIGYNELGLMLITGCTSDKISRKFPHKGVIHCTFSSNEKYLITFSNTQAENCQKMLLYIWNTNYNVSPIKTISCEPKPYKLFQLSYLGEYLSYAIDDYLFIYSIQSKQFISNNLLKIPGISTVSWSPICNELVYLEKLQDQPSNIIIIEIPSLNKRFRRQIFNPEKLQIFYHSSLPYLALIITRVNKKQNQDLFEIIHFTNKNPSVQTIETKTSITCFAWEPYGSMCIVIAPPTTYFYQNINGTFILFHTVHSKNFNSALWSPFGRIFILAHCKHNIEFELYHHDNKQIHLISRGSHFDANYIAWDSWGRYFLTCSCGPDGMNDKIIFWSCAGYTLMVTRIQSLAYCLWRPIPHQFINEKQINQIWDNIDELVKKHSEDIKSINSTSFAVQETNSINRIQLIPSTDEMRNHLKEIHRYLKNHGSYDRKTDQIILSKSYSLRLR